MKKFIIFVFLSLNLFTIKIYASNCNSYLDLNDHYIDLETEEKLTQLIHSWNLPLLSAKLKNTVIYFRLLELKDLDLLRLFLQKNPSSPLLKNDSAESDLMILAKSGWLEGFRLVLENTNSNLEYKNRYKTAFMIAAENGHVEILDLILNSNKIKPDNLIYPNISHALVEAAKNGHLDAVKLLLDFIQKLSPLNFNQYVEHTLVYATEGDQADLVQHLLTDFDVNINARSGAQYKPLLYYAIKKQNRKIINMILSYPNIKLEMKLEGSFDFLKLTIDLDDIETFTRIKEALSLDINKQYPDSMTLIHYAALKNASRITKYLIEDPTFILINESITHLYKNENYNQWFTHTPIAVAVMLGHLDVVKELLKHPEINVNVTQDTSKTIFSFAIEKQFFDIAKLLIASNKLKLKFNLDSYSKHIISEFHPIILTKDRDLIDTTLNSEIMDQVDATVLLTPNYENSQDTRYSTLAKLMIEEEFSKTQRLEWLKLLVKKLKNDPTILNFKFPGVINELVRINFHEALKIILEEFPHIVIEDKALVTAVHSNSIECLKLILDSKDVNLNFYVEKDKGNTLLGLAIGKNHHEIASMLLNDPRINLDIGYDKQGKEQEGTAGWLAGVFNFENPDLSTVKSILERKNTDLQLNAELFEQTLLMWSLNNKTSFFDFLLQSGLHHINYRNPNDGSSALILAVKNKKPYFVNALLDHPDIDLTIKDRQNKTALDYAVESDSAEIFELLVNHPNLDIYTPQFFIFFSNLMDNLIQRKKYAFLKLVLESELTKSLSIKYFSLNPSKRSIFNELEISIEELVLLDPVTALNKHFENFDLIQDPKVIQQTLIDLGFPAEKAKMIYDSVYRRDVGLWFLEFITVDDYFKGTKDSIDLLKNITNANFDSNILRSTSDNTLGTLTEFLIEIHKFVNRDTKFWNKINPELYNKKNIKELITFFGIFNSYFKTISGQNISYVDALMGLLQGEELNAQNIIDLTESTKKLMIASVNKLLNTNNFKFDLESYQRLIHSWGDLDPIWILISRLNVSYPNVVEVIRSIFKHSLEGTFKEFKFRSEKKQLQMFSEEQLSLWMEPESIINIGGQSTTLQDQILQSLEMLKNVVSTNLTPHWIELKNSFDFEVNNLTIEEAMELIQSINDSDENPNEILIILSKSKPATAINMITAVIDNFDLYSSDFELTKKIITSVKLYLLNSNSGPKDLRQQVLEDLNDIIKKINSVFTEAEGRSIIATVKNSDPKLLLTIGDIVCTSSCQNYKTGSVIRTLPGYVIDGNAQAIVSFELKSTNFHRGDFFKLLNWVETQDEPYHVEFDGNLRQFRFTKNQISIVSKPIEYAYLRNMLKAGVLDQTTTPALFMERPYEQSNPYLNQMRQQHHMLFTRLAKKLNASTNGQIRIFASKNPEGQYSDASGGIQKTDYIVNGY